MDPISVFLYNKSNAKSDYKRVSGGGHIQNIRVVKLIPQVMHVTLR